MSLELFDKSEMEMPSPKVLWKRKHDVKTKRISVSGCAGATAQEQDYAWEAWTGDRGYAMKMANSHSHNSAENRWRCVADSEDEALSLLAKQNNWRMWNEGGAL